MPPSSSLHTAEEEEEEEERLSTVHRQRSAKGCSAAAKKVEIVAAHKKSLSRATLMPRGKRIGDEFHRFTIVLWNLLLCRRCRFGGSSET